MRSVKLFIVSILSIFIVLALIGLLLPSKVTLSKSVLLDASLRETGAMINDFSKWKNWYPPMQKENVNVVINNSSTISLIDNAGKNITLQIQEQLGVMNIPEGVALIPIVLKTDVSGTGEAIATEIEKLTTDEVIFKIIKSVRTKKKFA